VLGEPGFDLGRLMGGRVVDDQVEVLSRIGAHQEFEKREELFVSMAAHPA
jgi:hypothetical protein